MDNWSLTSLQQRDEYRWPIGKAWPRYYRSLLEESHLLRPLFGRMLGRVTELPSPAGYRVVGLR
jgi:hypothetical protein